jgi:uncharacterized membrane protein (Fun14 family)
LGDYPVSTDSITSISATIGGGFIGGVLFGYALKKVVKVLAVIVGLFLADVTCISFSIGQTSNRQIND